MNVTEQLKSEPVLFWSSTVTMVVGTALNLWIATVYFKQTYLSNSIPGLLIVNQSIVDLYNSLVYCSMDLVRQKVLVLVYSEIVRLLAQA